MDNDAHAALSAKVSDLMTEVATLQEENAKLASQVAILEATACRSSPSTGGGSGSGAGGSNGGDGNGSGAGDNPQNGPSFGTPPHGQHHQCVSPATGEASMLTTLPFSSQHMAETRSKAEELLNSGQRVCFCASRQPSENNP